MHLRLHYAPPVWASALDSHAIQKKLSSAQRDAVMRIFLAYQTVLTSAVLILASIPPIDFLAKERQEAFLLCKEHTCVNNEQ